MSKLTRELTLLGAANLFSLIDEFAPEISDKDNLDIIEFIGKIVQNILSANKPEAYFQIVYLMTTIEAGDMYKLSYDDIFREVLESSLRNHLFDLILFFRGLYNVSD